MSQSELRHSEGDSQGGASTSIALRVGKLIPQSIFGATHAQCILLAIRARALCVRMQRTLFSREGAPLVFGGVSHDAASRARSSDVQAVGTDIDL